MTSNATKIIQDFDRSSFCARCILGISANDAQNRTAQNTAFWNSQIRTIFAVRTEVQTRQLLDKLNRCSCDMSDDKLRAYHSAGEILQRNCAGKLCLDIQTPAVTLISELMTELLNILTSANFKSVAMRTHGCWPKCPEDLMPFGPEKLVESFAIWSRFIPSTLLFHVAARCINFCGPLLIPYVVKSTLTQCVIDSGRRLFDRMLAAAQMENLPQHWATHGGFGVAFTDQVNHIIRYFELFYNASSEEQRMVILDGRELKALQVMSLFFYLAEYPDFLELSLDTLKLKDELAVQGYIICKAMALYIYPLPSVLLHPNICNPPTLASIHHMHPKTQTGQSPSGTGPNCLEDQKDGKWDEAENETWYIDMSTRVIEYIRTIRQSLTCSAPGCTNTVQIVPKGKFQRCSACKIASYCSKECQKAAWTSTEFPHKTMCKKLQTLVSKAGEECIFYEFADQPNPGFFPQDWDVFVRRRWEEGDEPVTLQDLFKVGGWAMSCTQSPPAALEPRSECEPGYEDYEAKIRMLGGIGGTPELEAQHLDMLYVPPEVRGKVRSTYDLPADEMLEAFCKIRL